MKEKKPFFSIVIPAHNEERYIAETLRCVTLLTYPHDRFEIIVVENASTDRTLEVCKQFDVRNMKVFSVQTKGVSNARNYGADTADIETDWILFLDADTHVKSTLLDEVALFLETHEGYTVGAVTVQPLSPSRIVRVIYMACNFWQGLTKSHTLLFL